MAPSTSSFWGEVRHLARPYYIVNIVLCLSFIVLKVSVRFRDHIIDSSCDILPYVLWQFLIIYHFAFSDC